MANRIVISKALTTTADADGIAKSQTPLAAGFLTLDGDSVVSGVAQLGEQRRVLLTFGADESAVTFTIVGTKNTGQTITEDLAGTATTAQSLLDYATVVSIYASAATSGALTAGTNGVGSSDWASIDFNVTPVNVGFAVVVSGTVNWTVQWTYDSFFFPTGLPYIQGDGIPTPFTTSDFSGKTQNLDGFLQEPISGVRLLINSGTGTATLTILPAGIKQ